MFVCGGLRYELVEPSEIGGSRLRWVRSQTWGRRVGGMSLGRPGKSRREKRSVVTGCNGFLCRWAIYQAPGAVRRSPRSLSDHEVQAPKCPQPHLVLSIFQGSLSRQQYALVQGSFLEHCRITDSSIFFFLAEILKPYARSGLVIVQQPSCARYCVEEAAPRHYINCTTRAQTHTTWTQQSTLQPPICLR